MSIERERMLDSLTLTSSDFDDLLESRPCFPAIAGDSNLHLLILGQKTLDSPRVRKRTGSYGHLYLTARQPALRVQHRLQLLLKFEQSSTSFTFCLSCVSLKLFEVQIMQGSDITTVCVCFATRPSTLGSSSVGTGRLPGSAGRI